MAENREVCPITKNQIGVYGYSVFPKDNLLQHLIPNVAGQIYKIVHFLMGAWNVAQR